MQSAFGTVVVVVIAVGVAGAIAALLLNRRTWEGYSQSHLVRDAELPGRPAGGHGAGAGAGPSADAERAEEIRQMMEARNARRRRRGEEELDLKRELGRLTGPTVDPELRAEIRDLVIARNARRARRGEPALDIEAEVEREIARLGDL